MSSWLFRASTADSLPPFPLYRAFPGSEYYGGSVPPPNHRLTTSPPSADLDGRTGGQFESGSHVHHVPVDGGGAQLFPGSLATSTPQAFLVTSGPDQLCPTTEPPSRNSPPTAAAARPRSARFESVKSLRGFHHWFVHSYAFPSCLPGPGCLTVPARPVVVEAAPAFPGVSRVRLPPASADCCDSPQVGPCIPPGHMAPRGARAVP